MSAIAPHLPPQACSISTHNRWSNVRWLATVVLISFLAGMAAALVVVDQWYPVGLSGGIFFAPDRGGTNPGPIDSAVVREWRYRVVTLYDETKLTHGVFYNDQARLGQAVIVNAGGWTIAPINLGIVVKPGAAAIDWQGKRYVVEKVVPDSAHGILFIKMRGSDFRATTAFAPSSQVAAGRMVRGLTDDGWQPYVLGEKQLLARAPYSIFADPFYYSLREGAAEQRILITDRGELIGFTNDVGALIPAWPVEYILPGVITAGNSKLADFDVVGNFVHGQRTPSSTEEILGFYVNEISGKNSLTLPIKRGDVLIKIQGEAVNQERLAEQIITAPAEFTATVWRENKMVDVKLKK